MSMNNQICIKSTPIKLIKSILIAILLVSFSSLKAQIGLKLELDACVKNDTLLIDIFATDTITNGTAFAFGGANFVFDILDPSGNVTTSVLWGDQIKVDSLDGPWDDSGTPNTDNEDYYDMTLNGSSFINLTIVPDENDNLGGGTNVGFQMSDLVTYQVAQIAIPIVGCGDIVNLKWRKTGFGTGSISQWGGLGTDIRGNVSFHDLNNVLLCNNVCASSFLDISGTDSLCYNGLGSFSIPQASNGDSIYWYVNGSLIQSGNINSFQAIFTSLDTIWAEVTNNACSNCPNSKTNNFILSNINPPISVDALEDTIDIKIGDAVQIFISDTNGFSYSWSPISGLLDPLVKNPFASPQDTTNYIVTVFGSDTNCIAYDTVVVNVIPNDFDDLIIRNFFSPNGDGKNDFWTVNDISIIAGCKVQIYSRWGVLIFETNDYQNDWGGTSKGNPVPDETYFYVISCDEFERTGAITLKR